MKLSLGYINWGKKARCNVCIMLGYLVNKMGVYVGMHTHTHTLTLVLHRLSLKGALINRNQGLPQGLRIEGSEIRKGA